MPKREKKTAKVRAKQLVKTCLKHKMNQTDVAEELGVTKQAIQQRLQQPIVKKTFAEIMEKAGITDEKLAEKMDEGLESVKVIGYLHQYKQDKDGNTSKAKPEEAVSNEFIDTPDMPTRHKYLTTALTIKGHLVPKIGLDDDTIDKIIRLPAKKAVGDPVDGTSAREG